MKYKTYPMMMEKIASTMRRGCMIDKKAKGDQALQLAISKLVELNPEIKQTLDFIVLLEEWYWLQSERNMYYLESAEVANSIISSKINLTSVDALYSGQESFMLALPKETMINGVQAHSGISVTIAKHSDRQDFFVTPFCKWLGTNKLRVNHDQDHEWIGAFGIYISYIGSSSQNNMVIRICLDSDSLINYINSDSVEEFAETMPDWEAKKEYSRVVSLTDNEKAYQFDVLKLVASFLVYKKALPDRIVKGYPVSNNEKTATGRNVAGINAFVIKQPTNNDAQDYKSSHYRRWHFRQLSHERYYRGEHKAEAVGSRIIFVQDSVVGREVNAKTVN